MKADPDLLVRSRARLLVLKGSDRIFVVSGFFQKAVEFMSEVPKLCNDMMNLGRLQGYEVRLHSSAALGWFCPLTGPISASAGQADQSGQAAAAGDLLRV